MRATSPSTSKRMHNSTNEEPSELRRGPWTLEEDTLLTHYIARHGEGRWNLLAKCAAVRCFWMPRLLQKVEQQTSSSCSLVPTPGSSESLEIAKSMPLNSTVPYNYMSTSCPEESKFTTHYSNPEGESSSSITSPTNSAFSTDYMTISQQPEIIEIPKPTPPLVDSSLFYNNFISSDNHYINGSSGFGMENGFSTAAPPDELAAFDNSPSECQMAGGDWMPGDMADTLWNVDDMWHFRELVDMRI
ncbi:hypothetical protein Tsubulata_039854 [Turnera subulata]|uniref:Myb-like domain-containing protein n=1 Tax=Turnera subulata TaxID=218843 RepID=A0A9Q0J5A4_9ROSI|nr:hypothetical protein Tsubulata_039854 [Turnera subulata]